MLEWRTLWQAGFFNSKGAALPRCDPMNKPPSVRLAFLDLLRGWAILVMMETHVFNTLLYPSNKAKQWFGYLTFINGLVAPSFLFVSGWVFAVASSRKLDDFRAFGPAFRKQLGRILLIWVLGYTLHLPFYTYSRTKAWATPGNWLKFCQIDILQCIAVGLLLLLLARICIKNDRTCERAVLVIGTIVVAISPFLGRIDFMAFLPAPIALYFQDEGFSYFPLFPWLGFLLCGGVAAMAHQRWVTHNDERTFMNLLGLVGLECVLAGIVFWDLTDLVPWTTPKVTVNPSFFALRLGCVILLLVAFWHYSRKKPSGAALVREISRESLLVYVSHILIIYRVSRDNQSLSSIYGNSLSLSESTALLAGLVFLMWVAASLWTWVKKRSLRTSQGMAYSMAVMAIVLFFSN